MWGQRDLKIMKNGGQQDRKSRSKLVQNTSKLTDFGKKLEQIQVILFLELNVIDKPFFLQKEGVNKIKSGIKWGPMGTENARKG